MTPTPDLLSPAARVLCDAMAAHFPDPAQAPLTVASMRAASSAGTAPGEKPPGPELAEVRELLPGGPEDVPVRMRLYQPEPQSAGAAGGRPLLLFLHGGGFVICDLDTHDRTARELAHRSGATVLSVDYRLAPEHPFPAATQDARAALAWALRHAEELGCAPSRVFVGGDSAGGNLAAGAALGLATAEDGHGGVALAGQLLIYPCVEQRFLGASAELFGEGYFMTLDHLRWFTEQYLGPAATDLAALGPLASPGLAPDLSGMPPTLLVVADCDILRDQTLAYARRLAAAGVPVEVQLHPGTFHGFLGVLDHLPAADTALTGAAMWLRHRAERL
ncbi:alpha/beta hydrolase [Streptacidiphilus fuscans]|uniref:Alpha/beta hydrolase n=1 Tax=Streptacidiphilus fuscans TaxID=2789292 RepID=A0A931B4Z8_9ACTN|nr:alpha/beta hydrolase [Streptacidiphilus fuscans]MBF9070449.1 alpha/beta hydrolase [Streptacidiphilus fuscans]